MVANASGYDVEVARTSGFESFETHQTEASPVTIAMPADGFPWFVRVRARRGSRASDASLTVETTPLATGWFESSPGSSFTNVEPSARTGSVLAVGDLNGDGRDDLVIGVPYASGAGTSSGLVIVHYGSPEGLVVGLPVPGTEGSAHLGASLAIGDFDCDGIDDLAVGEPFAGVYDAGSVRLYAGGPTGLTSAGAVAAPTPSATTGFGAALAAGDTNGDGCDDLAVGQSGELGGEGWVHLFRGSPSGLESVPVFSRIQPVAEGTGWGRIVVLADVNGDGMDDAIIGEPETGRISAYFSPDGLAAGADPAWDRVGPKGIQTGARVMAAGDLDADGYEDLVVTVGLGASADGILVFYGAPDDVVLGPTLSGSESGAAVPMNAVAADVDGDGVDDLLVIEPLATFGTVAEAGEMKLYRGSPAGLSTAHAWTTGGTAPSAELGAAIAAGDFDGDGWLELAVGAPGELSGQGRVHVYSGLRSSGILADTGYEIVLDGDGPVTPMGSTFRDRSRLPHRCEWEMFDGIERTDAIESCTPGNVGQPDLFSDGNLDEIVLRLRVIEGDAYGESAMRVRKEDP